MVDLPVGLGVSTIGNRRKSTSAASQHQHQHLHQQLQQEKAVQHILKRLESDSRFFEANQPYTLPNFAHSEIELRKELGKGEFGVVYEVSAIHVADECPCQHCQETRNEKERQRQHRQQHESPAAGSSNSASASTPTSPSNSSSNSPRTSRTSSSDKNIVQVFDGNAVDDVDNTVDVDVDHTVNVGDTVDNTVDADAKKDQKENTSPRPSLVDRKPLQQPQSSTSPRRQHQHHHHSHHQHQYQHRRVTSHISFAEDVKMPDDDSTLSTESDPDDFMLFMDNNDDDTDGEAAFLRGYMSTHIQREGRPRYAIKRLLLPETTTNDENNMKDDNNLHLFEAAVDLATEAKFLASIRHPNIVKMRGTVGTPGCMDFMIVMDCLVMTLRDKMAHWNEEQRHHRRSFSIWKKLMHNRRKNHQEEAFLLDQYGDKLLAVYDIARAMRYLHNQFIIFRDLKPENVAFDVRGDMRLFDFGLAKELKPKDLVQPPDEFCATGLTGSRRYMAPEVVQCKNYGLSADVYSYAILFWEVFSGEKEAFPKMNLDQHFEKVVLKGQRPRRKSASNNTKLLSKQLETMMVNMWAGAPKERPTFKSVCEQLGAECVVMNTNSSRSANSQLTDRTGYLMNRSLKSQCQGLNGNGGDAVVAEARANV